MGKFSDFVFIDFEYSGDNISEAGIVTTGLELGFKVNNKDSLHIYPDGSLLVNSKILAQNIYVTCRGKTIVHYGGCERRLIEKLLQQISNVSPFIGEFKFIDLQQTLIEITKIHEPPTLKELCSILGASGFKFHKALDDAKATKECFIKLVGYRSYYIPKIREYLFNRSRNAIIQSTLKKLEDLNRLYPELEIPIHDITLIDKGECACCD